MVEMHQHQQLKTISGLHLVPVAMVMMLLVMMPEQNLMLLLMMPRMTWYGMK